MAKANEPAEDERPPLDRATELRDIYDELKRELSRADTSSAKASISQQMRRTMLELEHVTKDTKDNPIDGLGGRRGKTGKPPAKRAPAKKAAPRKRAAAKQSKTPAKTSARKSTTRRTAKTRKKP